MLPKGAAKLTTLIPLSPVLSHVGLSPECSGRGGYWVTTCGVYGASGISGVSIIRVIGITFCVIAMGHQVRHRTLLIHGRFPGAATPEFLEKIAALRTQPTMHD